MSRLFGMMSWKNARSKVHEAFLHLASVLVVVAPIACVMPSDTELSPLMHECTVGAAMGTATADGRPICWKNRDMNDENNYVMYDDLGTYAFVGVGESVVKLGMNEMGLSVGNSLLHDMDTGELTNNYEVMRWILRNLATIDDVRGAIVDETERGINHWNGNAGGAFPFMDAEGNASLFEIGTNEYYEYDPQDPRRLAQFPSQFVVRANAAHRNSDHTDDDRTGGDRYMAARDNFQAAADSGDGITIAEMFDISRFGEPGGARLISNNNTCSVQINHGVLSGEDPLIANMWVSAGQPDYCVFVPIWVGAADRLPIELTSRDDFNGISGRSWALYAKRDDSDYDEYINSFYSGIEANLMDVVEAARERWLSVGFNADEAASITNEAATTAWHTMNTMSQGSGRNLNQTPELTHIETMVEGLSLTLTESAWDPDGSIVATEWDYGDGATGSGARPAHSYTRAGTYLVRCRVEDDQGSRNSRWTYVDVDEPNDPPIALADVSPEAGDAPLEVTFDGSSSTDPDGMIVSHVWERSGVYFSSGETFAHIFESPGRFTVTLRVTDDRGATAVDTVVVTVTGIPSANDADGDGMPDLWEVEHGLNPDNPADANLDLDSDGLSNRDEYQHGTDPRNEDSDGDGCDDGEEVELGTDPRDGAVGAEYDLLPPALSGGCSMSGNHTVELGSGRSLLGEFLAVTIQSITPQATRSP